MIISSLHITKKIILFFSCITLFFVLIIGRLIQLQVLNEYTMSRHAKQNFLRLKNIPSYRGEILDCKKRLIATNKVIYHLYWHGSGNKTLSVLQLKDIEKIDTTKTYYSIQKNYTAYNEPRYCKRRKLFVQTLVIKSFALL